MPTSTSATIAAIYHIFAETSGWACSKWKPDFCPENLPARRFLEFYSPQLSSVVVNYSFRAFPTIQILERWFAATPDFFRFSFKDPQRITHIQRLAGCKSDVGDFVSVLEPVRQANKLDLLLFQLPPVMKVDVERLEAFLSLPRMNGTSAPIIAFEFRNHTWFTEETYAVLRAALCIAKGNELGTPEVHTARNYTSFRLRRSGAYTVQEIDGFVHKFAELSRERDVCFYFKHEDEPTGALNAVSFLAGIAGESR